MKASDVLTASERLRMVKTIDLALTSTNVATIIVSFTLAAPAEIHLPVSYLREALLSYRADLVAKLARCGVEMDP